MGDQNPAVEKRRFPRLKKACAVRYKRVASESLPEEGAEGITVNISGGGICFEVGEAIEPGALLAIELTLPEFEAPVVSLGRTVWCEPREGGRFELGLEFWWIGWGDPGAQQAISDYIKTALES